MSNTTIKIGSVIDYPTVHNEKVAGQVELILENTVVVRDFEDDMHLVLKSTLTKDGFSIDPQTYIPRTRYSKR